MNDLEKYQLLFSGRTDAYAEGYPDPEKPGKYRYATVDAPLDARVLAAHLAGETLVGQYNLRPDSTVGWFAVDFDGASYEEALADARTQQARFETAGLVTYLERSRSGLGVHLWGFLKVPLDAGLVRRALKPLLVKAASLDRLYPLQAALGPKGYGNLLALPYGGLSEHMRFLGPDGAPLELGAFLAQVTRNLPGVITELATLAPVESLPVARLSAAGGTGLLQLVSSFGCQFVRHVWQNRSTVKEPLWYAAVSQATRFRYGRAFAQALSRGRASREAEVEAKFQNASQFAPVSCAYIHEHFPEYACTHCPMKAPYLLAERQLGELQSAAASLDPLGSFEADLAHARQLASGRTRYGIPWPQDTLGSVVRLRPGELTIVGAAPSRGKTWLLVDTAVRLARQGIPVVVFSAETGARGLRNRLLANAAQVDSRVLTGELRGRAEEWARLEAAARELAGLRIFVDYVTADADVMARQLEQVIFGHQQLDLDESYVVLFDYLQYGTGKPGEETRYERVSRLSSESKLLAKLLNQPVVAFSQVRRETESAEEPDLTWFKESGRIEADMDVGILLTGERLQGEWAPRQAHVVKQREGQANVRLDFRLNQSYGLWVPYHSSGAASVIGLDAA